MCAYSLVNWRAHKQTTDAIIGNQQDPLRSPQLTKNVEGFITPWSGPLPTQSHAFE
jgi:hypothetical protein